MRVIIKVKGCESAMSSIQRVIDNLNALDGVTTSAEDGSLDIETYRTKDVTVGEPYGQGIREYMIAMSRLPGHLELLEAFEECKTKMPPVFSLEPLHAPDPIASDEYPVKDMSRLPPKGYDHTQFSRKRNNRK